MQASNNTLAPAHSEPKAGQAIDKEHKKETPSSDAIVIQRFIDTSDAFFNSENIPDWAKEIMVEKYKSAQQEIERSSRGRPGYIFTGATSYNYSDHGMEISSNAIIARLIAKKRLNKNDSKLKVCDIGSGDNKFVDELNKNPMIHSFGISAADYRYGDKRDKKADDYIIDNAEFLSAIPALKDMDGLFSRLTFIHLENPAKALVDAYRSLKPGAMLVIDKFKLQGLGDWLRDLVGYLKSVGYEVVAHYQHNTWLDAHEKEFRFLSIVKTKNELSLPITYTKVVDGYNKDKMKIGYAPTAVLKEYRSRVRSEVKNASMEDVRAKLIACFNNPEYSLLNARQQAQIIKDIVSVLSPEQKDENFKVLKRDKELWVLSDFSWIMQNQYPFCKLAAFVKDRGWHQDPDVALAQVIALASAELEIESDIRECSSYFQKHLGMMPTERIQDDFNTRYPYETKPVSSFYEKDIKILPPALLKPAAKSEASLNHGEESGQSNVKADLRIT